MAARERIHLDRFNREFSADPSNSEPLRRAVFAPGAMRAAFNQFAAFSQDAKDNQELLGPRPASSPCRCWAVGGGTHSYGPKMAGEMSAIRRSPTCGEQVITNSGHWLMEEQPQPVAALKSFL